MKRFTSELMAVRVVIMLFCFSLLFETIVSASESPTYWSATQTFHLQVTGDWAASVRADNTGPLPNVLTYDSDTLGGNFIITRSFPTPPPPPPGYYAYQLASGQSIPNAVTLRACAEFAGTLADPTIGGSVEIEGVPIVVTTYAKASASMTAPSGFSAFSPVEVGMLGFLIGFSQERTLTKQFGVGTHPYSGYLDANTRYGINILGDEIIAQATLRLKWWDLVDPSSSVTYVAYPISGPPPPPPPPPPIFPEPSSLLALGSGLAGLGGVFFRRRRR